MKLFVNNKSSVSQLNTPRVTSGELVDRFFNVNLYVLLNV